MKVVIDLNGTQTETHYSGASSIGECEKLNSTFYRCKLFGTKLPYDFEAHAFRRCEECINAGYVEDFKEELRMSELGNKQLCEEIKALIEEKNRYFKIIKWIKEQYDTDFTEKELDNLEPRDECIYSEIKEVLQSS